MTEKEINTFYSPHCGDYCCEFVVTVQDGRAVSLKAHPNRLTTCGEKLTYNTCLVEVAKVNN